MSASKVLRSNRDFPVGGFDYFGKFTCNSGDMLIIIKNRLDFRDVLVVEINDSYLWHYKFPSSRYDYDGIIDTLKSIL